MKTNPKHGAAANKEGSVGESETVRRLADRSRTRTRRRFVFRSSTWLIVLFMAGFVLIVWQRNTRTMQETLGHLNTVALNTQKTVKRIGWLPPRLILPDDYQGPPLAYTETDLERAFARKTIEPMIIAWTPKQQLIFRGDHRAVLIYRRTEPGKTAVITAEWMPETEFQKRIQQQRKRIETFASNRRPGQD